MRAKRGNPHIAKNYSGIGRHLPKKTPNPKMNTTLTQTLQSEKDNLWLWAPVLFGFGAAFYLQFEEKFLSNFSTLVALFFVSAFLYFLNRNSLRSLIFLACSLFLLGSFYTNFYQKIFLSHTEITGKVYVDGVGKVESIKLFRNPVNGVEGARLVISQPVLYKSKFVEKKKITKKKKKKKSEKKKKPRKKKITKTDETPKPKKKKKKKGPSEKTIKKNYLNLKNYQEIDREFLDYSKNYQQVEWFKIKGRERFPNPPQKISINIIKNFAAISVNDVIALRMMLQPATAKEFLDDFDFALDSKFKKIGAYGFAIGEAKILSKAKISSSDEWFLSLREKIRAKISAVLLGDSAAIALAFLIGDQNQISENLMVKIRNSGLAHLLSISGFHLSLASMIFFVSTRFILARSQYLALNFDLKKFAAIAAICGTYFYLKIAASPLPAQRAFVMVLLILLAMFVGEKINSRRAIMLGALCLILFNPYAVFNVSFQLSFAAILVLGSFYDLRNSVQNLNFLRRVFRYFLEIILLSILIQIATTPFLMRSFQNVALLGFIANVLAIPLTSFFVMPLGFLALFLMPIGLEKYALLAMEKGIFLIEKIAIFVTNLEYSNLTSPQLSSFGLVIAIIGLLLICLSKSHLRFLGIVVFLFSFVTIFYQKKPDILFDGKQKFFAIYDENGLAFSKNIKATKKREIWMKKMNEVEFKVGGKDFLCDEEKCIIKKNQKFLVLLTRNKISEICKNDFDVIVNLTAKYALPNCIAPDKIKIDNSDFYKKGGHFFYFSGEKILIKTTS